MDQTTLASSLSIIGNALGASDQTSWISGGYFVYVPVYIYIYLFIAFSLFVVFIPASVIPS